MKRKANKKKSIFHYQNCFLFSAGAPQFLRNFKNKSTQGMSIAMVALWTVGDMFKTCYFIFRHAPMQFWICGTLQVSWRRFFFYLYFCSFVRGSVFLYQQFFFVLFPSPLYLSVSHYFPGLSRSVWTWRFCFKCSGTAKTLNHEMCIEETSNLPPIKLSSSHQRRQMHRTAMQINHVQMQLKMLTSFIYHFIQNAKQMTNHTMQ